MFSGEIYYTDPLIQLTKSLVKHCFSLHIYCVTYAVAVMHSRNIRWQKSKVSVFKANKVGFNCYFDF